MKLIVMVILEWIISLFKFKSFKFILRIVKIIIILALILYFLNSQSYSIDFITTGLANAFKSLNKILTSIAHSV